MIDCIADILTAYREMNAKIARFQAVTGFSCPSGCGSCCESRSVEATVLEILPMAEALLSKNGSDSIFQILGEATRESASSCMLYRPVRENPGQGRCGHYEYRPLVCRLFGFSGRRDRKGTPEPSLCGRIKDRHPEAQIQWAAAFSQGCRPPMYQDTFMRIASMNPAYGAKLLPINTAIREGLKYCYLKMGSFMNAAA